MVVQGLTGQHHHISPLSAYEGHEAASDSSELQLPVF